MTRRGAIEQQALTAEALQIGTEAAITQGNDVFNLDAGGIAPDGIKLKRLVASRPRSQWFEAEQVRLGRTIALKRLQPFLAANKTFRASFFEAGRQAAVIVHSSALPIINIFMEQNCIATQWRPGRPFEDAPKTLDAMQALSAAEKVMDCLSSLHATDRCHGNLSPGNVFLDDAGGVWIDDFFQPPIFSDGEIEFTADRRCIAPEVLSGEKRPSWTSDVFSLGRLIAMAIDPERCPDEVRAHLDAMQADDPANRGESPSDVAATLRKFRKREEARRGINAITLRRARRLYRRVPAEFDVSLRRRSATPIETATILTKILDIGESGVFIETEDEMMGVGSIIELDFALKGVEGNIHAFGIVRWRSTPPLPPGVGVQFVEVDKAGLARLRQFLENRR